MLCGHNQGQREGVPGARFSPQPHGREHGKQTITLPGRHIPPPGNRQQFVAGGDTRGGHRHVLLGQRCSPRGCHPGSFRGVRLAKGVACDLCRGLAEVGSSAPKNFEGGTPAVAGLKPSRLQARSNGRAVSDPLRRSALRPVRPPRVEARLVCPLATAPQSVGGGNLGRRDRHRGARQERKGASSAPARDGRSRRPPRAAGRPPQIRRLTPPASQPSSRAAPRPRR